MDELTKEDLLERYPEWNEISNVGPKHLCYAYHPQGFKVSAQDLPHLELKMKLVQDGMYLLDIENLRTYEIMGQKVRLF